MENMVNALPEQAIDMVIVKGIPGIFALFAVFDQPGIAQETQLVRDGRLAYIDDSGNITDAHLPFGQHLQDFNPGTVAQDPKQFGHPLSHVFINKFGFG